MKGKFKDQDLKKWSDEFKTYRDVIHTPGWRMLESLILAQRDWYREEQKRVIIDRTVPGPGGTRRLTNEEIAEEVARLECHAEEDEILLDMILNKLSMGAAACRILTRRLEEGGLKQAPEIKVPEFKEIG